jgi:hypothetical protein
MSHRKTTFALIATLAALFAPSATADTLFTSTNRTTPVALGTTASVLSSTVTSTGTLGGSETSNSCTSSTLTFALDQNNGAAISGTFTSGDFTGCVLPVSGTFPWRFTVRGSGVASGSSTVFTTATWDDVTLTVQGLTTTDTFADAFGSPPSNGLYVRQTTASGTGICFVLADAPIGTPILTNGKMNATYCLEGTPSTAWTIGPTLTPPPVTRSYLRADPVGTTLPGGSTVSYRASDPTTLTTAAGTITCGSATVDIVAGASGGTGVIGALNGLGLASCTDTIPSLTFTACTRTASPATSVFFNANTATGGTQTLSSLVLRCPVDEAPSFACYFGATSLIGTVANTPSSTTYNNAPIAHTVPAGATDDLGTSICGTTGTFSTRLTGLTQVSTGTTVTLRQS